MNPNFLHPLSVIKLCKTYLTWPNRRKKKRVPLKSNIQKEDEVYRMTEFFNRLSQGNGLLSAAEPINNPLFGDYHLITPVRKFVTDIYVICLICGNPRSCTRPSWAGPVGPWSPLTPLISVRVPKAQWRRTNLRPCRCVHLPLECIHLDNDIGRSLFHWNSADCRCPEDGIHRCPHTSLSHYSAGIP